EMRRALDEGPPRVTSSLAPADDHLDRVAPGLDLAGPRALGDDEADSPGASAADATHGAACPADPRLGRLEPQSDHARHVAAHAWWWRRWRWWRWWRR